jgi:hypothetical protein
VAASVPPASSPSVNGTAVGRLYSPGARQNAFGFNDFEEAKLIGAQVLSQVLPEYLEFRLPA